MPLAAALAAPSDAELELLFAETAAAHTTLAARLLGDADAAHDAVQEAWIRAWRARGQVQDRTLAAAWLRKIVVRECLRTLRWRALRRWVGLEAAELAGSEPPVLDRLVDAERVARVRSVLAVLPPQQRVAWTLRVEEGWPLADIAATLDVSTETVKTHLARATSRLRSQLDAV